jgi:hypothetical protein
MVRYGEIEAEQAEPVGRATVGILPVEGLVAGASAFEGSCRSLPPIALTTSVTTPNLPGTCFGQQQ